MLKKLNIPIKQLVIAFYSKVIVGYNESQYLENYILNKG